MTDKDFAKKKDDYDTPWKEIIENYFPEFIAFFFPYAYDDIDWKKGYEFLDKELRQISHDAETGRKYVDKLVRVWLKNGEQEWALVHADIQIQRETHFDERMYIYNYRLFDRFRRHAASFAVIGESRKWQPGSFEKKLWGCEIRFCFPVVRLSDYAEKQAQLKESGNPFAIIVLAHLCAHSTAKDKNRRLREKIMTVRHLYQKGYSKQDIVNIFRFIDWIMSLPEELDRLFWQDLAEFEEERKMPYITSVERIGYQKGKEEGIPQGEYLLIAKMIARKFGADAEREWALVQKLHSRDLLDLADSLPGFSTLDAVHNWIHRKSSVPSEQ